jgi:Putative Ig domain/Carbohydrate binding module (family 6)
LLQDAQNMGVTIPLVNVMAMDYYEGDTETGNAAISAAENTLSQMKAVNGSCTYADVGITPMSTGQFTSAFTGAGGGGGTPPPPAGGPYGGTAAAIPGTVQAADYDTGGQGAAYDVASANGAADSHRPDGVDLEACTDTGCGDDIGWTAAGQWFKYTVNAAAAGTCAASLRLAAPSGVTDGLRIASSAGASLSGNINVPATGGRQTRTTVTAAVALPAGLSISPCGLVSGTPTTAATSNVTVTATDTAGAKGPAGFTWTISSTAPPPSSPVNGGFETGSLSPRACQAGECDQTITLSPNTTYTLAGWTQGNYAYIGVSGQGNVYADDLSVS